MGRESAAGSWLRNAADQSAEMGATARLVAAGTPVTPAIAQQVLASIGAFDDLIQRAPDEEARTAAQSAGQAVRALGIAIDADASTRRAQPPATQDQLDSSAASLLAAAAEADHALRTAYNRFTAR